MSNNASIAFPPRIHATLVRTNGLLDDETPHVGKCSDALGIPQCKTRGAARLADGMIPSAALSAFGLTPQAELIVLSCSLLKRVPVHFTVMTAIVTLRSITAPAVMRAMRGAERIHPLQNTYKPLH